MAKRNKIQTRIENPIRFFYPTSDGWHPNFPRNTVEISVYVYYNPDNIAKSIPNGMIRIVVRGADDTAMDKDIRLHISEYEAKLKELRFWLENSLPNPLTKAWLKTHGFQFA